MAFPKALWRWSFYDFANSGSGLIFQAFLLPVFFTDVLVGYGASLGSWGLVNGVSTLIGVCLAVLVGRYADKHDRMVVFRFSLIASFCGMVLIAILVSISPAMVFWAYLFMNAVFILSLSLSDSLLPHLSTSKQAYEYSGFAWGFGYLGGVASLLIVLILQAFFSTYSPVVFLSVALFYAFFSWYALRGLRGIQFNTVGPVSDSRLIPRSKKTILLLGYWLIMESITVLILFFSIFASDELHLSRSAIGASLLVVQLVAFPATWLGSKLIGKFGHMSLLGTMIVIWGIILGLMVVPSGLVGFGVLVFLAGLVLGNTQSFLRAQYSTLVAKGESGFQFGIYSFISQASVSIGPVVYGLASDSLGSQKIPLIFLYVLMVVGYFLIRRVTLPLRISNLNIPSK